MIEVGMRPWKDFVVLNVLFQDITVTDMFSDLEMSGKICYPHMT